MKGVRKKFKTSCYEITIFLLPLKLLAAGKAELTLISSHQAALSKLLNDSWQKTLKATAFLMLYNLMESTIRDALEAIYLELARQNVSFDQCRQELKKIILKNLKQRNPDELSTKLLNVSLHIITETYLKKDLVKGGGSIDARKIKEYARAYGFNEPKGKSDSLLVIKNARNDLAHGHKNFTDVGKDISVNDLRKKTIEVFRYLQDTLNQVEDYLVNKKYS